MLNLDCLPKPQGVFEAWEVDASDSTGKEVEYVISTRNMVAVQHTVQATFFVKTVTQFS